MNNLTNVLKTTGSMAMATNGVLAVGRVKSKNEMLREATIQAPTTDKVITNTFELDAISMDFIKKYL